MVLYNYNVLHAYNTYMRNYLYNNIVKGTVLACHKE